MNTNNWQEEFRQKFGRLTKDTLYSFKFIDKDVEAFISNLLAQTELETEKRVAELERIRCEEAVQEALKLRCPWVGLTCAHGVDLHKQCQDCKEVMVDIKNSKIN